ncbi:unnamed protein product [Spirodela intermedia]|uniref:Uncharacterized protein n=1 Tax=Spirodela intermedia TaxID=51605 RepID=A0A7I8JMJ2_SPIIN|nr:unnamed protein product [Spirodela intermedia]CAA6671021.1 unnamed protein product [Spirodela intermedia]
MEEGDGAGQEGPIEQQLELQLDEQRETLIALDEALASDPSNAELLSVREELIASIRDAEDGLLHLKRSRLLRVVDEIAFAQGSESLFEDPKSDPLDPTEDVTRSRESEFFSVGSKCRFRYSDGRWYNGYLVGLEGPSSARISFLNPTSEKMLMCKFFLQQRCHFGSNCRMSHGLEVPISSLKHHRPTAWQQSLVGSSIWAASGGRSAIWKEAELESWDDKLRLAHVVFRDGSSDKLGVESLSLSPYAQMTDEDEDESSSEASSSSEEDEDSEGGTVHRGVGFLAASNMQRGVQTETAIFAKWEHHTRGIASKMMVSMGYREGMGLGYRARVWLTRSLKKRSRGGKREREKKQAAIARANNDKEQPESDVFSFINEQLAGSSATNGSANKQRPGPVEETGSGKREDRRSLVAHNEKVKELRSRVERLEEMISRNRRDKGVFEAASRKLDETRRALVDAEAAHASASNAIVSKEKEKRWLRF